MSMKPIKLILSAALTMGLVAGANAAPKPQDPINLDQLLEQLQQGKYAQSEENKARLERFRQQEQRQALEQQASDLETRFESNETQLGNLQDTLTQSMGSLKELFGVLQQVTNDAAGSFQNSVISAQYPGRSDELKQLSEQISNSSKLASIEGLAGATKRNDRVRQNCRVLCACD